MDEISKDALMLSNRQNLYINTLNNNTVKQKSKYNSTLKRNRRPLHSNKRRSFKKEFRLLSYNITSLQSRLLSFSHVLNDLKPKVWSLQETHMRKAGKIKFPGSDCYQIYELIRSDKGGGGLAVGVCKELQSVWVRQGEGEVETLTVMVSVSDLSVRVTNGYGPQEYSSKDTKEQFWQYLQDEVNISINEGVGCLIMLDANCWLGNKIIPGDPHCQNRNGKLFYDFLNNNGNLSLLNNQKFCQGKITRERKVENRMEYSIIDFMIACDKVLPYAKSMWIDEDKKFALTNFHNKKKGRPASLSDHNLLYAEFIFKCIKQPKERKSLFNYNNVNSLSKYQNATAQTNKFTKSFMNSEPFSIQVKNWEKNLRKTLFSCFQKIRIKPNNNRKITTYISNLLEERKAAIMKDFQKREKN